MVKEFRSDIEGLRAISILAVLLFHVGIQYFSGGFIGVDVFFVISGYVITRIIDGELRDTGNFSFRNFYLRRARRLLPTLFTVLLSSTLFAVLLFSPAHLKEYGESLLASLFGVANIYFFSESGYFETMSSFKPLLHNWSLAVEEQFYLFWPAFLWLMFKTNKAWWPWALIAIAASIFANYIWMGEQTARFFLTPFRTFELLIGAVLAVVPNRTNNNWVRISFSAAGISAIIISVLTFSAETDHPSLLTLIPCIGVAAVIYFGPNRLTRALLSNPFMTFIGRRSYTIYLIHWPVLVFFSYGKLTETDVFDSMLLIVVSVLLAIPVYKWIEDPFRRGEYKFDKVRWLTVPRLAFLSTFVVGMISVSIIYSEGAEWRIKSHSEIPNNRVVEVASSHDHSQELKEQRLLPEAVPVKDLSAVAVTSRNSLLDAKNQESHKTPPPAVANIVDNAQVSQMARSEMWADNSLYGGEICAIPCYLNEEAKTGPVFVVGDSFSRQLASGLKHSLADVRFKIFDHRQCSFFSPEWIAYEAGFEDKCLEEQKSFFAEVAEIKPKIIFANHWAREIYFRKVDNGIETRKYGRFDQDHAKFIFDEIEAFKSKFQIKDVIVVGNPPSIGKIKNLDMCVNRPLWFQSREDESVCNYVPRAEMEDRRFLTVNARPGLSLLDLFEPFCDISRCETMSSEGFYFFDNVHLTKIGSKKAIAHFEARLRAWIDSSVSPIQQTMVP